VRRFNVPNIHRSSPHPHIAARTAAVPPKIADAALPAPDASRAARGVGLATDAVLHTALDIQHHLEAQDAEIEGILAEVRQLRTA